MLTTHTADSAINRKGQFDKRIALPLAGIAVYGLLTSTMIAASWRHFELAGILVRYALLLPAVLYALRQPGLAGGSIGGGRRSAQFVIAAFLLVAASVSCYVGGGVMIPDESSYRFQARTLAAGRLIAPAPPGAPERPVDVPVALNFTHQVISKAGWYSKYPIGWPAVLAIPERMHAGWLVNPVLGALLLVLIGCVAREAFGSAVVLPAIAMAALSAYMLANSVGRMSHGLSSVLVAAATLLCVQGVNTGKLSRFAWMFALIIAAFHVRPFTAFVTALVLGVGSLIGTKNRRGLCIRVAAIGAVAAVLAIGSVMLYNWRFTGDPLLSPYALFRGTKIPRELMVTTGQLAENLKSVWRFALQSTLLYTFPFLAPLIVYRFRVTRSNSIAPWLLLALPCALVVAHLVQFEGSASILGERYWFEGYFGAVILAADGLVRLIGKWRSDRRAVRAVTTAIVAVQVVVMAAAATKLVDISRPRREVRRLAETYTDCNCVVFFKENLPEFTGKHLNLNGPDWSSAGVFYAIDPGLGGRAKWTALLHKPRWVVLAYDAQREVAKVDGSGSL
ncbi:MAG: hypothetical protein M3Y57_15435 [Acidobacteriota bacterium]|nr:hypothetical protein [Acidobacteriota bacterium]